MPPHHRNFLQGFVPTFIPIFIPPPTKVQLRHIIETYIELTGNHLAGPRDESDQLFKS